MKVSKISVIEEAVCEPPEQTSTCSECEEPIDVCEDCKEMLEDNDVIYCVLMLNDTHKHLCSVCGEEASRKLYE